MKKLKYLITALLIFSLVLSLASCYFISAQSMRRLEGTYKLVHYTYTPKYEKKEGYTPKTIDYINDEEYKYEVYLVITGDGMGYYAHKDASGECYVKEVTLQYTYSQDEPDKVEYVIFNDSVTVNASTEFNKMGVSRGYLNYTKNSFDYTELITKRKMRSEAMSIRWEKVDKATDLSFVNEQLDNFKSYSYAAFGMRGIYELSNSVVIESGEHVDNPYRYFYYVVDTADGAMRAQAVYAMNETPTVQVREDVSFALSEDGKSSMNLGGRVFALDAEWSLYYVNTDNGLETQLNRVSHDNSEESLENLVNMKLPQA